MVKQTPARRLACVLAVVLLAGLAAGCSRPVAGSQGAGDLSATPSPTPISAADLNGLVDGNVYRNEALGFEVTFPESYTVLDRQQTEQLMTEVIELIKDSYGTPEEAAKVIQKSVPVTIVLKHPLTYSGLNSSINIIIDPEPTLAYLSGNIVGFANYSAETSEQTTLGIDFGEAAAVTIGGRAAAMIEGTSEANGIKAIMRQYYLIANEHLVILSLGSISQSELNELVQAVDSFRYY